MSRLPRAPTCSPTFPYTTLFRSRSSRQRRQPTMISTSGAGNGSSSATCCHASATISPSLMRLAIDALLERRHSDAAVRVDEPLVFMPVLDVGLQQAGDGIHHLVFWQGRANPIA